MTKIHHLVRFHIHNQRAAILSYLLSLFVVVLIPNLPPGEYQPLASILSLLIAGALLFRIVAGLNEKKSPVSSDSFWLSRPVNRRQMALSHLIVIVAVLALPLFLAQLSALFLIDATHAQFEVGLGICFWVLGFVFLVYAATAISSGLMAALALVGSGAMLMMAIVFITEYFGVIPPSEGMYFVAPVIGFLSLVLVFLPPFYWCGKRFFYVGLSSLVLPAILLLESNEGKVMEPLISDQGDFSVEFLPSVPPDANPAEESYYQQTRIKISDKGDVLQPLNATLDLQSEKILYLRYRSRENFDNEISLSSALVADAVLRNLPDGTTLATINRTDIDLFSNLHRQISFPSGGSEKLYWNDLVIEDEAKGVMTARSYHLVPMLPLALKAGELGVSEGYRVGIVEVENRGTHLHVKTALSLARKTMLRQQQQLPSKVVWVLCSPRAKKAVMVGVQFLRNPDFWEAPLVFGMGIEFERISFPLPETFSSYKDIDLRAFIFEPRELLELPVTVRNGRYQRQN